MIKAIVKTVLISIILLLIILKTNAQDSIMTKLPDTGQTTSFSSVYGEDSDYSINMPSFKDNSNGTINDNITNLVWQKTDAGEMTWEMAKNYCSQLNLAGYSWRLPDSHELFGIINHNLLPAIDKKIFTLTTAEYWWTSQTCYGDTTKVWVVNSGGGIGPHPKNETISAGGSKHFHTRCVKNISWKQTYTDNKNGTITDSKTGLTWQKEPNQTTQNWFDALRYAESLQLAGHDDWRLPNIKELQSISEDNFVNPSVNSTYFPTTASLPYWSSTTMVSKDTLQAWIVDFGYGIATYSPKTNNHYVRCVRGGALSNGIKQQSLQDCPIKIIPNPIKGNSLRLQISLKGPIFNDCEIEIYNSSGKLVASLFKGPLAKGEHSFIWAIENLHAGVNILKCTANHKVYYSNFIVI